MNQKYLKDICIRSLSNFLSNPFELVGKPFWDAS